MKRNSILTWGLVLLAVLFLFRVSQTPTDSAKQVPYSTFQTTSKKVTSFHLLSDSRTFYFTEKGSKQVYKSAAPEGSAPEIVDELSSNGVTVRVDPPASHGIGGALLITLLPVILLIAALFWLYRRGAGGVGSTSKNPAALVNNSKQKVKLSDVAGNAGDFDDVYEIIDFLKDPQKYHDAKASLPHGILLYGPPGVGKTLLAKAIAGEAGVPFYTISGSAFVEMFVGVGASRVRSMFENLRKAQPAILFIDEIDAVGGKRSSGKFGSHREADQTLNQLLTEMDGFNGTDDTIVVIGATNRPDFLDPALLRPGRFDRKIAIGLPDINARQKILEVHTKDRALADDVNLSDIARGTPGMSGADLANLVNESAMIIGKEGRTVITMADLDSARDKIFMGRERSLAMDSKEKQMTAYHEAGHAIASYFAPEHDPVYKITIIPRDRALGVTMYLPEQDKYSVTKKQLKSQLVSLMGGRAAEELIYGPENVSTGASNDLERATSIARGMVSNWGLGETTGLSTYESGNADNPFVLSEETKKSVDKEVREILESAYLAATKTLMANKDKLTLVAERLVLKETIDFCEFKKIMEGETDVEVSED